MSTNFKRIPYGIANFKQVRNEHLYLVDKTVFFEKMGFCYSNQNFGLGDNARGLFATQTSTNV